MSRTAVFYEAWSGSTPYLVGDIVISSSVAYICISAHTNHVPPNGTYWLALGSTPGVTGLSKNGSTVLTGAVTLSAGTGISLTQSSQDIAIAATGGSGPGTELDYVTQTSDLTVTATTSATAQAFLTGNSVSYDGSTRVKIEFWTPGITNAGVAIAALYDGSTDLTIRVGQSNPGSGSFPMYGAYFLTPASGSHTYSIKFWRAIANMNVAGNGGGIYTPAWLRVTRA